MEDDEFDEMSTECEEEPWSDEEDEEGDEEGSIEFIRGNLFSNDDHGTALAHCVSSDLVMGKGIAVEFKRRFGRVDELREQEHGVGAAPYLRLPGGRFVFYMVTKEKYNHKPTYATIRQSLRSVGVTMDLLSIKSVAIPKIGCGLDRKEWSEVEKIVREEWVEKHGLNVVVYSL